MGKYLKKKNGFSVRMQSDDWSFSLSSMVCVIIGVILTLMLLNLPFWCIGQ
jgi:hypothetical protein